VRRARRGGLALLLAPLLVSGCAPSTPSRLLAARIEAGSPALLVLDLDLKLSAPLLEALDHGVPLSFAVDVRGDGATRGHAALTLSQQPLSGQYALDDGRNLRVYARRAQLLAALDHLRLPLDAVPAGPPRVRLTIAADRLPGPLRLPALLDPDWQIDLRGP
jgi:hypothetical protein